MKNLIFLTYSRFQFLGLKTQQWLFLFRSCDLSFSGPTFVLKNNSEAVQVCTLVRIFSHEGWLKHFPVALILFQADLWTFLIKKTEVYAMDLELGYV